MISFDLRCATGHVFEGWFRSSVDYDAQCAGGLIACPLCGAIDVTKAVMAPAVAMKGNKRAAPVRLGAAPEGSEAAAKVKALLKAVADLQAESLKDSEWVGDRFADRARAMHYGEAEQAVIHGTADAADAKAMIEEGLAVAPLLVPIAPPDQTN